MNNVMKQKQVAMKRTVVALLSVLFAASTQAQTPAPKPGPEYKTWALWSEGKGTKVASATAGVEKELMQLEHDWAKAVVARDVQALDRILAPDWSITDTEGAVKSKAQTLSDLSSGKSTSSLAEASDMKVRVYGETALVIGRWTEKSSYSGKDTSGGYQFTDTFIRRDGRWQCVASHASKVVQK